MSQDLFDRRGILRGLATLPLVGGADTLIGQPKASAEPVTPELLESYRSWLFFEKTMLDYEMARRFDRKDYLVNGALCNIPGARFHRPEYGPWNSERRDFASHRAAIVLSAVGCDWHSS